MASHPTRSGRLNWKSARGSAKRGMPSPNRVGDRRFLGSMWIRVGPSPSDKKPVLRRSAQFFGVGSRTHARGTFLCAAKEKYPKERPPGSRESVLRSSLSAGVDPRDILVPGSTGGIHSAPPLGYSRQKLRCSARLNGMEDQEPRYPLRFT